MNIFMYVNSQEACVGVEPTHGGFANRSVNHFANTPYVNQNMTYRLQKLPWQFCAYL